MLAAEAEKDAILDDFDQSRRHWPSMQKTRPGIQRLFYGCSRLDEPTTFRACLPGGAAFDPSTTDGWTVLDVQAKAISSDTVQVLPKSRRCRTI